MGRPNKGARDQMMVYPPQALGAVVRLWADAVELPHGEYIASVLAEHFGHPYWAAPEVRMREGGLRAMLREAGALTYEPTELEWTARDTFVTKPVLALGTIVRDEATQRGVSLTRFITEILAGFHHVDLESFTVATPSFEGDIVTVARGKDLRQEVQRLLA